MSRDAPWGAIGERVYCRPTGPTGHLSGSAEPGHAATCRNQQPSPEMPGFSLPPRNGSFESRSRGKTVEGWSAVGYLGAGGRWGHYMGTLKVGVHAHHTLPSVSLSGEMSRHGALHWQERGLKRTGQGPSLPPPCAGPGAAPRRLPVGQRDVNADAEIAGWVMDPGHTRHQPEPGCVLKRTFVHFSPS